MIIRCSLAFFAAVLVISIFGGCLNQDFERESLAKYQATRATTFVGFNPIPEESSKNDSARQATRKLRPRNGFSFPAGRFSQPTGSRFTFPGGGNFSQPGGRFSFPSGNRFSFPGDSNGRMSVPNGLRGNNSRFSWPRQGESANRFSWPQQNAGQFSQPRGRFTVPSGRFTSPSEG